MVSDFSNAPRDPRFLADVMLGSLARWLRILGYDTAYDNRIRDPQIVELARAEDRLVLTRDRRLCRRRALRNRHLLIESSRLEAQLSQVLEFLDRPFPLRLDLSRCVSCNGLLETLPRSEAKGQAPSYVWQTHREFKQCRECGRLYWRGTHRTRMLERLKRLAAAAADRQ